MSTLLPGQPVVLPSRGPAPQLGAGIYVRDGRIRASLLGIPTLDAAVRHQSSWCFFWFTTLQRRPS